MIRHAFVGLLLAAATTVTTICSQPGHCQDGSEAEVTPSPYSWSITRGGVRRYAPEKWGVLQVAVVNPSEESAELLSSTIFGDDTNVQFGRRLWVPPRAKRTASYLVRPSAANRRAGQVEIRSFLFDISASPERTLTDSSGRLFQEVTFPLEGGSGAPEPVTALYSDGETDVAALVMAMRVDRNLSTQVVELEDSLPVDVAGLELMDQLILSSDRLVADSAGLTATRRWLRRGGRLWIMLDRVDPMTVTELLGDAFEGVSLVDRIHLSEFQVVETRPQGPFPSGSLCRFEQAYAHPVEMIRVLAPDDVRISHAIDGWPVAFWLQHGEGEVLLTSLEARAFLHPHALDFRGDLAFEFFSESRSREGTDDYETWPWDEYVSGQVGYEVVSRPRVTAVLGAFCAGLLGLGVWLIRIERLERFLWYGPMIAAVVAASLVSMGHSARHAVPPTLATVQLVHVVPRGDEVRLSGLMGVYTPQESESRLQAERGGWFWPELRGREGTVRRMVATDFDRWHWDRMKLPDGLMLASFEQHLPLETPLVARATLGPEGLTGRLEMGPFQGAEDALLAFPAQPSLAVRVTEQGDFFAGPRDVMVPGQFLTDTVLSDEQRRRRAVYERIFRGQDSRGEREQATRPYPTRPTLFVWSQPQEMGFRLLEKPEQLGSALLMLPLELDRPVPGTEIVIPTPLISYRAIGVETSGTLDNETGQWLGPFRQAWNTTLRFQIPREVLPFTPRRATLSVALKAPGWELEITARKLGEMEPWATRRSPVGRFTFEITASDMIELDEDGGLILGVNVGAIGASSAERSRDSSGTLVWEIDDVRLEVAGQSGSPVGLGSSPSTQ